MKLWPNNHYFCDHDMAIFRQYDYHRKFFQILPIPNLYTYHVHTLTVLSTEPVIIYSSSVCSFLAHDNPQIASS